MATNRKKIGRVIVQIGTREVLHLLHGCCLMGCQLCHGAQGVCPPGVDAWTFKDFARDTWRQHRMELLKIWRQKPVGEPQAGFRAAAYRGYGFWFPAFAEVVFDGVAWPVMDATWPEEVRDKWDYLDTYLKGVASCDY